MLTDTTNENISTDTTVINESFPDLKKPDAFEKLKDEDKKFVKVQEAMSIIHAINMLEGHTHIMLRKLQGCFPQTPYESVKIIMTRLDDIKSEEVQKLSLGFIKTELFTIDGKEVQFKLPENLDDETIRKHDELNYYRAGVMMLKLNNEQIAAHQTYINKLKDKFSKEVDSDIKTIISSVDSLNEYTETYYNWKLNDPDTDETTRKNIEKTLQYVNYAITLEPIKNDLNALLKKKGSLQSVMYNFRHQSSRIVDDADKACKSMGITFPYALISNMEAKFFGSEKYEKYKYLFTFLIARHVRYYGNNSNLYDKIFLTQLFSNLVYITRSSDDPLNKADGTSKLKAKMKPYVQELLDLVINHI